MSVLSQIFGFVGNLIEPVTNLIDEIVTSDEEKAELHNKLETIKNTMNAKILDFESKLLEKRADLIKTEALGESSLQRNWRPIAMITFLTVIVFQGVFVPVLGLPATDFSTIPSELWTLLTTGIGGYIGGRTIEKAIKTYVNKK